MATKKPEMVDVRAAGEALGVSVATVWRLIRSGALPSVRSGGRRLVPARALRKARRKAERPPEFTREHPLWRLAGAGRSGGAGPGSSDKHGILDT